MANFSSFFPTASGGGFTKMNKYVTMRSLLDATHFAGLSTSQDEIRVHPTQETGSSVSVGSNEVTFYRTIGALSALYPDKINLLVGKTFTRRNTDGSSDGQVYTITSIGAHTANSSFPIQFTPSLTVSLPLNHYCDVDLPFEHTVNPATDLDLSDGDSIGYMLVGAGYSNAAYGGRGGKIIYGTAIITNASTDLVLTPGVANGANSTITGGLTLSSGDGSIMAGGGDHPAYGTSLGAGSGIMGYGAGGGGGNTGIRNTGSDFHGWGGGSFASGDGGDGAILLYY